VNGCLKHPLFLAEVGQRTRHGAFSGGKHRSNCNIGIV
jgi:hypothetical protein